MSPLSEAELFRAHGIRYFHCSHIEREGARRTPCDLKASAVYFTDEGIAVGFCLGHHTPDVRAQAVLKGWRMAQPEEVAA